MISTVDLEAADSPAMLDTAARTIGMFRLIGHGVDVSVIQEAHTTIRRVFATQEDECSAAGGLGFQALGAESLSGNAGADKSFTGDLKETFTVRFGQGVEVPWPAAVPDAEVALMSYDAAMTILADRLLGLADDALGLEAGTLPELCSNPSVVLRALHYPPSHSDQTRAGAHTDFGTLSFLTLSGDLGGLQVQSTHGSWVGVAASPTTVLVNFGEIFARLTGAHGAPPCTALQGKVITATRWPGSTHQPATGPSPP